MQLEPQTEGATEVAMPSYSTMRDHASLMQPEGYAETFNSLGQNGKSERNVEIQSEPQTQGVSDSVSIVKTMKTLASHLRNRLPNPPVLNIIVSTDTGPCRCSLTRPSSLTAQSRQHSFARIYPYPPGYCSRSYDIIDPQLRDDLTWT